MPWRKTWQKIHRHPKTSKWDNSGPNRHFLMIFFLFFKLDQDLSRYHHKKVIKQVVKNGVWWLLLANSYTQQFPPLITMSCLKRLLLWTYIQKHVHGSHDGSYWSATYDTLGHCAKCHGFNYLVKLMDSYHSNKVRSVSKTSSLCLAVFCTDCWLWKTSKDWEMLERWTRLSQKHHFMGAAILDFRK